MAEKDCATGDRCLETEALAELLKGTGIQIPVTTQNLIDGIKSKIAVAQEMVGAANNAYSAANESGIFGISSIFVEEIGNLGSSTGNTPVSLQTEWGDGAFVDAIEGHMKTILPTDLSKFAENFGQIESAVSQSKKAMHNAVTGASESISGLAKVAGQFAPMASGGITGATFTGAADTLKTLGNIPLEEGATALLESVQGLPGIRNTAMETLGTLDLTDFTDTEAQNLLSSVTDPTAINEMKTALGCVGSGSTGADFLDKAISSAGAISTGEYSNYVKDFAGNFGALANEGIGELSNALGGLSINAWVPGQGDAPSGGTKVSSAAVSNLTEQFGGGSGGNGAMSFKDMMGSVMGPKVTYDEFGNRTEEPSEFEQALEEYQAALSGNTEVYEMIKNACYGDWTDVTASSDGGTIEGIGADPTPIPDNASSQLSLNAVLSRLLPDAPDSNAADAAAAKVAAIMQKEKDAWAKMSLPLTDAPKVIENVQALTGFASSLASKMQDNEFKSSLENMLSGATKSLGDSAVFEKALQDTVGVSGTNRISPPDFEEF